MESCPTIVQLMTYITNQLMQEVKINKNLSDVIDNLIGWLFGWFTLGNDHTWSIRPTGDYLMKHLGNTEMSQIRNHTLT